MRLRALLFVALLALLLGGVAATTNSNNSTSEGNNGNNGNGNSPGKEEQTMTEGGAGWAEVEKAIEEQLGGRVLP